MNLNDWEKKRDDKQERRIIERIQERGRQKDLHRDKLIANFLADQKQTYEQANTGDKRFLKNQFGFDPAPGIIVDEDKLHAAKQIQPVKARARSGLEGGNKRKRRPKKSRKKYRKKSRRRRRKSWRKRGRVSMKKNRKN